MQDGDVEHVFYKVIEGDMIVTAAQLFYAEPESASAVTVVLTL